MPLGASLGDQLKTQNTIFGQEHVLFEDVHAFNTLLTQLFRERVVTMEILLQGTTHDSPETIGGESTRQHTDISKGTLQRLVKDVTDLVLEVLGGNQGVDQIPPTLTQHGVDFTTRTSQILVVVESLPERHEGLVTGLGTGVQKNDDFWVENTAESVEQPSMRVDLLAVLLLQAEHHLHGRKGGWAIVGWPDELLIGGHGQLSCVFKLGQSACISFQRKMGVEEEGTYDMCQGLFSIDITFHDTILVDTNGSQDIQDLLVTGVDTIEHEGDDNLLPGGTTLVPELGFLDVDDFTDVLHGTMQGTGGEGLVFVIVGDGDEQFGVAVVHGRTKVVTIVQGKLVGITRSGGVLKPC